MRDTHPHATRVAADLVCVLDSLLSLPPADWPHLLAALRPRDHRRIAKACQLLQHPTHPPTT